MNITDVGHLTDDADKGEDKIEKGAAREKKTALEIARFYEVEFLKDIAELNIKKATILCRATEHIKEQITLIKRLEKKGFIYKTVDGIYFDTSKISDYGKLARLNKADLKAGVRVSIGEKKNETDFALWKFSPKLTKRQMEWSSPWGVGFPGWHIECSAMSAKYLGQPFDIHCGGIDHIPVHHTNEIAQSEAAFDKPLANYWIHNEFLILEKDKMSKSGNNFITLDTVKEKKISPLAYRYFLLQTHYRKQLLFSWPALKAAATGLNHLYHTVSIIKKEDIKTKNKLEEKFLTAINNDLDTPKALAILWQAIKNREISYKTIIKFDEVLGLDIQNHLNKEDEELPEEIKKLISARDEARKNKNWEKSDKLRDEMIKMGYEVLDTPKGTEVKTVKSP
jgi:cysteinyl-tRNA synthetase